MPPSSKIVIDEDISNLFFLITFMGIELRRSEMFTSVTAPQKRKHTQCTNKLIFIWTVHILDFFGRLIFHPFKLNFRSFIGLSFDIVLYGPEDKALL